MLFVRYLLPRVRDAVRDAAGVLTCVCAQTRLSGTSSDMLESLRLRNATAPCGTCRVLQRGASEFIGHSHAAKKKARVGAQRNHGKGEHMDMGCVVVGGGGDGGARSGNGQDKQARHLVNPSLPVAYRGRIAADDVTHTSAAVARGGRPAPVARRGRPATPKTSHKRGEGGEGQPNLRGGALQAPTAHQAAFRRHRWCVRTCDEQRSISIRCAHAVLIPSPTQHSILTCGDTRGRGSGADSPGRGTCAPCAKCACAQAGEGRPGGEQGPNQEPTRRNRDPVAHPLALHKPEENPQNRSEP